MFQPVAELTSSMAKWIYRRGPWRGADGPQELGVKTMMYSTGCTRADGIFFRSIFDVVSDVDRVIVRSLNQISFSMQGSVRIRRRRIRFLALLICRFVRLDTSVFVYQIYDFLGVASVDGDTMHQISD